MTLLRSTLVGLINVGVSGTCDYSDVSPRLSGR